MKKYPLISIIIATLNSEKTLAKTLISLKDQDYPQNKIEIFVVDAGSNDKTLKIAEKYHCKILMSSKIENTYAKHIGFLHAHGKYLMFLDSDEVLENKKSLQIKYSAFESNPQVKMVLIGGYKTPMNYSSINYYINEFGDPFSFFMYRESKGNERLLQELSKKYSKNIVKDDNNFMILDLSNRKTLPLIELWAGGCMFDLVYAKSHIKNIERSPSLLPHMFYLLNNQKKLLAVTKHDPTIHYSSATIRRYLKKISSRIQYNTFQTSMGKGGYSGRENFSHHASIKKYLFIPYSLLLILPILDSIYLSITRKKSIYLIHWLLCLYTVYIILYFYILKSMGYTPKIKKYGT